MSAVLPIGLMWIVGLITALLEVLVIKADRIAKGMGVFAIGVALILVVIAWFEPTASNIIGKSCRFDRFALFVQAVILFGGLGAILLQKRYLTVRPSGSIGLLMCSTSGAMLLACAFDMVIVLVGFLCAVLPLFVLAVVSKVRNGREAALKGLIIGVLGTSLYGLGMALMVARVHTTGLAEMAQTMSCVGFAGSDPLLIVSLVCLLSGMGCMIALVPFHMWFVDFMEGLTTPGSMLLCSSVMVGGLAAFARLLLVGFQNTVSEPGFFDWISILHALSLTAILASNAVALVQGRFMRMAAYLVVGQVGLVGLTLAAVGEMGSARNSSVEAMGGVLVFLAVHAISWLGYFVAQSVIEDPDGSDPTVERLSGLAHRRPWLALSLGLALLCMAGMPPSAGFFSRLYLLKALVDAGWNATALMAGLSSGLVLVMCLGLVATMVQKPADAIEPQLTSWTLRVVAVLTSFAILGFGILPEGILNIAIQSAESLW